MDLVTFLLAKRYASEHATRNYNELENKPQINGITLSGNKTTHDLSMFEQVTTMPAAGADYVGRVVQYVGVTTSVSPIYTHCYFYECVENGGVYSWRAVPELYEQFWHTQQAQQ